MADQPRHRHSIVVLAVGVVLLSAVWVRALTESAQELEQATELRPTDAAVAVRHYRNTLTWYAPFNPNVGDACEGLRDIANEAMASNDRAQALDALDSLRSGLLTTRSIYTPRLSDVLAAERDIAALRGLESTQRLIRTQQRVVRPWLGQAQRAIVWLEQSRRHYGLLVDSRNRAPDPTWSVLVGLGLLAWLASTALAIRGPRRFAAASLSVLSLTVWVLSLTNV
ncbi:MAG: hypothetical protein KC561_03770 [Myxococcales bacterium]|nr:hypothetical protein [Myxococcales bacterium]